MTDFALKTATECELYIEAIFHCLSHAMMTHDDACRDIRDLIFASKDPQVVQAVPEALHSRIDGIMQAFRSGAIDQAIAKTNYVALLSEMAERGDCGRAAI